MFNIVICVYNKLEVTEKCIQSIRQYTPKDKYMIFFVNDGSEDIVRQWIKNQIIIYDDIIYIENKKNLGYVLSAIRGVEESIKSIDNPFIFVLNNDVFITDFKSIFNTTKVESLLIVLPSNNKDAVAGKLRVI